MTRTIQTVAVKLTPEQKELHDALLWLQAQILSRINPTKSINLMMTTLRRQAVTCPYGLSPLIKDILNRRIENIRDQEWSDDYFLIDAKISKEIRRDIKELVKCAKKIVGITDPKLEALQDVICEIQGKANNKLMIFSCFRHSLEYLFTKLSESSFRVGMVHGGTPNLETISLLKRFNMPCEQRDAIDLLLFSDIACENFDYKFCKCIVNYDIPWSPMHIEQRINRIDHNGQNGFNILIYNFITPDTLEADIYERCLFRCGVFDGKLVSNEDILRETAGQIRRVAEDDKMSTAERKLSLQQIADNINNFKCLNDLN